MAYHRTILHPAAAEPADYVGGRRTDLLSPRRRLAIIVGASAGLWLAIGLIVVAALT